MHENKNGEIFNDFGERIWPSSKDQEMVDFVLEIRNMDGESEWCLNGGSKHRMIQTVRINDIGKREYYHERVCFDCGKTASFGMRTINQYKEI